MLRIISLNLNGIRSAWSKNVLPWTISQQADVIALQELKAQLPDLNAEMLAPDGMHAAYHAAEKKGYSGVGIWSRQVPDQVIEGFDGGEFDAKGRYIRADFGNVSTVRLFFTRTPGCKVSLSRYFLPENARIARRRPRNHFVRRLEYRPSTNRSKKLEVQPEKFGLFTGGARLAKSGI